MELTNKTCNILQTGKKNGSGLEVNMDANLHSPSFAFYGNDVENEFC